MKQGGQRSAWSGFTISAWRQQWHRHGLAAQARTRSARTWLRPVGFTIVETLIVLAVTGVLLLSVIALISGKQDRTEFQQGINDVVSQLQQVGHDVSIGYYPTANNLSCAASVSLNFTAANKAQGTSQGCIFLGKILQFGTIVSDGNEQFAAYVLAGCEYAGCAGTAVSTTPAEAKAQIVPYDTFPAVTQKINIENGLQTRKVTYYDSTGAHQTEEFGILQSQGGYVGAKGVCDGLCPGSQQFSLYGVQDTGPYNPAHLESLIKNTPAVIVPASKVVVCMQSGTTNQFGIITINGEGSTVSLRIQDGGTC